MKNKTIKILLILMLVILFSAFFGKKIYALQLWGMALDAETIKERLSIHAYNRNEEIQEYAIEDFEVEVETGAFEADYVNVTIKGKKNRPIRVGDTIYLRNISIYDSNIETTIKYNKNEIEITEGKTGGDSYEDFYYNIDLITKGTREVVIKYSKGSYTPLELKLIIEVDAAYANNEIGQLNKFIDSAEEQAKKANGNLENVEGLYNRLLCLAHWVRNGRNDFIGKVHHLDWLLESIENSTDPNIVAFKTHEVEGIRRLYNETIQFLAYQIEYNKLSEEEKEENKENYDEMMDKNSQEASQAVSDIKKYIMEIIEKQKGEGREKQNGILDVLSDGGIDLFYTEDIDNKDANEVEVMVGRVLSVITSIGMVLSVIVPAILGIKYMLASVEERADYKSGLIPYIVGSFLVFGICTVVKILQAFGNSLNTL